MWNKIPFSINEYTCNKCDVLLEEREHLRLVDKVAKKLKIKHKEVPVRTHIFK